MLVSAQSLRWTGQACIEQRLQKRTGGWVQVELNVSSDRNFVGVFSNYKRQQQVFIVANPMR